MKRILSVLITFVMIFSVCPVFAAGTDFDEAISLDLVDLDSIQNINPDLLTADDDIFEIKTAEEPELNCVPDRVITQNISDISDNVELFNTQEEAASYEARSLDVSALTKFNTVTSPKMANGANEPKFSLGSFMEENISDYSGELTLNFDDLVLDGKNGLDLNIGRTYKSVASNIGEQTVMILPDKNGILRNTLVTEYSNYTSDRYNLGVGWSFNFPSVQVETEYIPKEVADTYYYDEETELYYHTGNGDVYQVEFTTDETDSNLKGYYKKDIVFAKDDTGYSNNGETSYYSLTLADKTKQYFSKDGRLLAIRDRFANTIKFEYAEDITANIVPAGNFYEHSQKEHGNLWTTSVSGTSPDAYVVSDEGVDDNYSMWFSRNNTGGESFIASYPMQIKPMADYKFSVNVMGESNTNIAVEFIGYDTAYNHQYTEKRTFQSGTANTWNTIQYEFSMPSSVRYVVIKITPSNARHMYIDNVCLGETQKLLSKITDSVGRTVDFTYSGGIAGYDKTGSVSLTVTSPDGADSRTLTYNKIAVAFENEHVGNGELRYYWYLTKSNTEGTDGSLVQYEYLGGVTYDTSGNPIYPTMYLSYDSKTQQGNDNCYTKIVLSGVQYKDRKKIYEYETVRKHMGIEGYYDTLRVTKAYDMFGYVPQGSSIVSYQGELNSVSYSYSGEYNGNTFNNETGYPSFKFDEDTTLNELWTVTKTGSLADTVTFSNCTLVKQTSSSGGTTVTSEYTNHGTFKNSPVQIKNTITQNGASKNTYILFAYNDWGGVSSETKEVDESIKNNSTLLEKYTTTYQYNDFHYITQICYYTSEDKPAVTETNTYDSLGRLSQSKNAVGDKISYFYENESFPYAVTKTVQDDPMGFGNVMGGDSIITYTYDTYGLYALSVSENYNGNSAVTSYVYDYITGELLKQVNPIGGATTYTYYSDGKVKNVIKPASVDTSGRTFFPVEIHSYQKNVMLSGYTDVIVAYSAETIYYYVYYTDGSTQDLCAYEINFYDAAGNLKYNLELNLAKVDSSGNYIQYITKYYHDNFDRLIKTVDADGVTVTSSYDGFDRTKAVTDGEGNVYNYSYNNVQNTIDLSLNGVSNVADNLLLTQKYDIFGNLTENIVYPDNIVENAVSELYEYDLTGNVTAYTDPKGNITEYSYDSLGRLTETILPNGEKITSSYSSFGEAAFEKVYSSSGDEKVSRATLRNEKGDVSMKFFSYDKHLEKMNSYSADSAGRITSVNEGGTPKTYSYDHFNNTLVATAGESQIHRRYTMFGEALSIEVNEKTSHNQYGYDGVGRVTTKRQDSEYRVDYTYTGADRLSAAKILSNRTEQYTYTQGGNLDTITTENKTYNYDYYDTGLIKSITYPNGIVTEYEYDNVGHVTSMSTTKNNTVINNFEYEYDANGNVVSETRNGAETTYSYDSLDRLISVTYNNSTSVSYEYDALNNRTKETYSNGDVKDYVYNSSYQLEAVKENGVITDTYTYNDVGAVVTHNEKIFTYDEWDKLSSYSDGTDTYTYKYDANGIRTQKNNKTYVIDINNNVVAETDNTGTVTSETLWGHKPLARKINGSWYYYIYNAHGDVVGLVNDAGAVVNTYEYDAWGNITYETETVDNPIKYAGEYYDDELDMYYLRARYYDPNVGRFTTEDPVRDGVNWYVYCGNNPVNRHDPSGMSWSDFIYANKRWGFRKTVQINNIANECLSSAETFAINNNINGTWNNKADAYRHFLWNARLTREFGYYEARDITNMYEYHAIKDRGWLNSQKTGGNTSIVSCKMNQENFMDLWNNQVGRELANNATFKHMSYDQLFDMAVGNNWIITNVNGTYSFLGISEYADTYNNVNVYWDMNTGNIIVYKNQKKVELKIGV